MSDTTLAQLKQEAADLAQRTFIRKDLGGGRFAVSVTSQHDVERLTNLNAQIAQREASLPAPAPQPHVVPVAAIPFTASVPDGKTAREVELERQIAETRAGMTNPATATVTGPARRTEAQLSAQIDAAITANIRERYAHQKGR